MEARIDLITVMADNVPRMVQFYRDVLGFRVATDMGTYVEFENQGVRFAVCERSILETATGHPSFGDPNQGQSFGLAFPLETVDEVDQAFADIVAKGAKPVKAPALMPWGQKTGFFADPEGNIHELFADLPPSETNE